jgi:hypothetical protein
VLRAGAAALSLLLTAAPGASSPPAADAQDVALCRQLAGSGQAALRPLEVARLDLDGDGRAEALGVESQGTAHYDWAYVAGRAGRKAVELAPGVAQEDDWLGLATQRWLTTHGRAYLLHYAGWGTAYLHYVGRVGGDGKERLVCRFQPVTRVSMAAVRPQDAALCAAVSAGRVRYAPVARLSTPEPWPAGDFLAARGEALGTANVDFDNSGRARAVTLVQGESSAGSGCQLSFYDTAASPDRARLAVLQGLDFKDTAFPRRTCYDAEPRWFAYADKHYLETRSRDAAAPRLERSEYHWVDVLEGGRARRVCEARYLHRLPRLTGVWKDAWTR